MTLRRLAAVVPLALSVAVVAHVVGFGADHAPGGGHAAVFLGCLAAALVACGASAFGFGFLKRPAPSSIATPRADGYLFAGLVACAAIAFLSMELAEGHAGIGRGTLAALCSLVPSALLVAVCSRRIATTAAHAGMAAARTALRVPHVAQSFSHRRALGAFFAPARLGARATRGRAPPTTA